MKNLQTREKGEKENSFSHPFQHNLKYEMFIDFCRDLNFKFHIKENIVPITGFELSSVNLIFSWKI